RKGQQWTPFEKNAQMKLPACEALSEKWLSCDASLREKRNCDND
ncbi:MAG: hypothetical protein QOJ96_828, partial [Alphaproteobacteria bacterium]|nr:hypothetical protein [Alphaproteobacteria bacterium]